MKKITILLFFTLFLFTSSALAMGMIKAIATLGKSSKASSFLSKNIDEIKNTDELAKKLEELKLPQEQIDELYIKLKCPQSSYNCLTQQSGRIKNVDDLKNQKLSEFIDQDTRTEYVTTIKEDRSNILNKYQIDNLDNVGDIVDDFLENNKTDNKEIIEAVSEFKQYIQPNWIARFYRLNKEYSTPNIENKFVLSCKTEFNNFIFVYLMEQKSYKVILTKHTFSKFADIIEYPNYTKINNQELIVLNDNDDFFLFSTQLEPQLKFPQNYFAITKNGYFMHRFHLYGQISPKFYISRFNDNIPIKYDGFCKIVK